MDADCLGPFGAGLQVGVTLLQCLLHEGEDVLSHVVRGPGTIRRRVDGVHPLAQHDRASGAIGFHGVQLPVEVIDEVGEV